MKFFVFATLLVVAGAYAAPQNDVEIAQPRIYDLIFQDLLQRGINWMDARGWDPLIVNNRNIDLVLVPGFAEARGLIGSLHFSGLTNIITKDVSYDWLWGRLYLSLLMPELWMEFDNTNLDVVYRHIRGSGQGSGRLVINDIRIVGNVLIKHDQQGAYIDNINLDCSIGRFWSDVTIVGTRDYSEAINNFINFRLLEVLEENAVTINVALGELVKIAFQWWRERN